MNANVLWNDDLLVKAAQRGDKRSYERLFQKYHYKIERIILFLVNDPACVHDLSQDVFLKVFENLQSFKEESQFSTWLYRIIQNTVKNYFRAINSRHVSESSFADEFEFTSYVSPEYQLINLELNQQVESGIARLSDELRLCYGLHIFEGQTYKEIAKEMRCPIGTVRSRIFRARKLMMDFVRHNI